MQWTQRGVIVIQILNSVVSFMFSLSLSLPLFCCCSFYPSHSHIPNVSLCDTTVNYCLAAPLFIFWVIFRFSPQKTHSFSNAISATFGLIYRNNNTIHVIVCKWICVWRWIQRWGLGFFVNDRFENCCSRLDKRWVFRSDRTYFDAFYFLVRFRSSSPIRTAVRTFLKIHRYYSS